MDILESLNEEQIKPVVETEGAVLVLAGAGSGKTRVLTSRIAHILDKRLCHPSNVLAITFTNKAANEMKERVGAFLGDVEGMWICTIHSMCVRILRRHGEVAGIRPNFSIYSESERANVIKRAVKALEYDEKVLKAAKFHIANAKMLGLDAEQYALRYKGGEHVKASMEVYELYCGELKDNNALDFDDLLVETRRLLRAHDEVREYLSDKFKYIHVDEFQDTNEVQFDIIKLLASKHGNLFVVGDDDQSIYGWRGAEIENILRFDKDFPSVKVFKLQRNYRSTKSILSLANAVIARNGNRYKKTLWTSAEEGDTPEYVQADDEKDEALFAAKTINSAVYAGGKFSDFAVLMRINALTRSYEQEFAKYGIPYKVFGGFKFFERKEIKDVLAYMRLISNPFDDEAMSRIINVPRRGIGNKTLELMDAYSRERGLSLFDACLDVDELALPKAAKTKVEEFGKLIRELIVVSQTEGVDTLVRQLYAMADIKSAYDDNTDEGDAKLANLEEFAAAVNDFVRLNPSATLNDYLNQVTLASDIDDLDDGNYVTLATIHAVKGLEFNSVFLCGLEEGIIPTSRSKDDPKALEEERRLMYVAITRAKKRLWLTRSKSRFLYGHREPTAPSPFVGDFKGCVKSSAESSSYGSRSRQYGGYGGRGGYRSDYGNDGYEGDYWSDDFPSDTVGRRGSTYSVQSTYGKQSSFDKPKTAKTYSPSTSFTSTGGGAKGGSGDKNYTVGCKVSHPKFGVGTVIAVRNNGTVLNVAFENQGIKELSASIAPLKKL